MKLLTEQDIGLIFLDSVFSIPNFPSRVLDYLNYGLPIFACTDIVSDIKQEICDKGCGFWCKSGDIEMFKKTLETILLNKPMLSTMRECAYKHLDENYNALTEAKKICDRVIKM